MTDPSSANKVLVALAERAAKRRNQFRREESKKTEELKENQSQLPEISSEEIIQKEKKSDNFRPKKNIHQPIKEEFPSPSIEETNYEEPEEYQELEDTAVRTKVTKRFNSYSDESNIPIRRTKRTVRFNKTRNPENADSFEEQVELVGDLLCNKLSAFQSISALRVTQEWIDCIVDENDSFYEEVYNKLSLLDKDQLLGYIRILVSALK